MNKTEQLRLRRLQREFDEVHFDRVYEPLDFNRAKVQHIGEHIGKAGLKLFKYKRAKENHAPDNVLGLAKNAVKKEVVPDLLIYRTQLANTLDFDLFAVVSGIEPEPITVNLAIEKISLASFLINQYIEPIRHSPEGARRSARMDIRNHGLPALHEAAYGIANQFGVTDLDRAYIERLEHLRQQPAGS